jgi:hypothetical protein
MSSSASPPPRIRSGHAARRSTATAQRSLAALLETLLDAVAFFEEIEPRLVVEEAPDLQYAYVELLPDRDPTKGEPEHVFLTRPMGLDTFEVFLPSLATRITERRSAQWQAADAYFTSRMKAVKKAVPAARYREIRHVLRGNGKVLAMPGSRLERIR